jgi:hypothetical protein
MVHRARFTRGMMLVYKRIMVAPVAAAAKTYPPMNASRIPKPNPQRNGPTDPGLAAELLDELVLPAVAVAAFDAAEEALDRIGLQLAAMDGLVLPNTACPPKSHALAALFCD